MTAEQFMGKLYTKTLIKFTIEARFYRRIPNVEDNLLWETLLGFWYITFPPNNIWHFLPVMTCQKFPVFFKLISSKLTALCNPVIFEIPAPSSDIFFNEVKIFSNDSSSKEAVLFKLSSCK